MCLSSFKQTVLFLDQGFKLIKIHFRKETHSCFWGVLSAWLFPGFAAWALTTSSIGDGKQEAETGILAD